MRMESASMPGRFGRELPIGLDLEDEGFAEDLVGLDGGALAVGIERGSLGPSGGKSG